MTDLSSREASVRGDAPANHAGETGSIPVSRSKTFQDFSSLNVRSVHVETAKSMIVENHYSHK